MNNIFTANRAGQSCIHKKTRTICVIKSAEWYKGALSYDVLIPCFDDKANMSFNAATYSEDELELINK